MCRSGSLRAESARGLLTRGEALAAAAGAQHIWLTAWVGNTRALAFYSRRGYTDNGPATCIVQGEPIENRLFVKTLAARVASQPVAAGERPTALPLSSGP